MNINELSANFDQVKFYIQLLGNPTEFCNFIYRIFPKYGPGVNYFQMASDQALNWTWRSYEIQKNSVIN